jgi:hypothetical protein
MAYTNEIQTIVTGTPQLEALGSATDKQTERTKRLSDAVGQYVSSNDKLAQKLIQIQLEETKLEQLRERHRMSTEALASSTTKAAGTNEVFNASLGRTRGNAMAATAALRELEGASSMRAAGRFLSNLPGLGSALQIAFPIVGALALLDVVKNIGEGLNKHLHLWEDTAKAEKDATAELRKYSEEATKGLQNLAKLQQEIFTRQFGPVAGAVRAEQSAAGEAVAAQQNVSRLEKELAIVSRIAAAQEAIRSGRGLSGAAAAPVTPDEALHAGFAGISINAGAPIGATGAYLAPDKLGSMQAQLREARVASDVARANAQIAGGDTKTAADREATDAQRKLTETARKRQAEEERIIQLEKRAADEWEKSLARGENPLAKFSSALAVIGNDSADELRRSPARYSDRINAARGLRSRSALNDFNREQGAAIARMDNEDPARGLLEDLRKDLNELFRADIESRRNLGLGTVIGDTTPAPPPGYVSPAQQMRNARLFSSSASRQARGGSPDEQYQAQLAGIEAIYQAEIRVGKTEQDRLDALDSKNQKIFEAQVQREDAIAALVTSQINSLTSGASGFVMAAQHGKAGSFIRSQFENLEGTVIQNVLKMVIGSDTGKGVMGALHLPGTLGKIFAGTPFGADPAKAVTVANTTATTENTAATLALTRAMAMSRTGGGGGALSGFSGDLSAIGVEGVPEGSALPNFGNGDFGGEAGSPATVSLGGKGGASLGKVIGYAAAAGAAAFGAYSGFKAGGAQGALSGTAALAGGAAAILSLAGVSGPAAPILAGVGVGLGLISALIGDPKANREAEIARNLKYSQFMAPVAINETMSTNGTYSDFDRFGGVRSSSLSATPQVAQGYFDYRHNQVVPGYVTSPFGGPSATPVQVINHIYAMDGQDVERVLTRHPAAMGKAMNHAVTLGHAPEFQNTIRH